jgi:hypothetical protein
MSKYRDAEQPENKNQESEAFSQSDRKDHDFKSKNKFIDLTI